MVSLLAGVVLFAGCTPPGARALLEGKRLLDEGKYPEAIEELRAASQLLPTNALAFDYLGLACHQAGQAQEAERAYQRALALNHDLTEVHYNLGCLWLNQSNRLEQAKSELTTYTLRRSNAVEGWLKLGDAQLRSREVTAAEKSFGEALRLSPQNPEALTGLGLARYQRRRAAEAAQFFRKALKEQPDYRPALLNLAVVAQQELNDPQLALQRYREYLALKPPADNAEAVAALARQLEQELHAAPHPIVPNVQTQIAPHTNAPKAVAVEAARPTNLTKLAASDGARPAVASRPEAATNLAKTSSPTNVPKLGSALDSPPPTNVEVVKLAADPVFKPAEDVPAVTAPAPTRGVEPPANSSSAPATLAEAKPAKRSFFQRVNPFARDSKPAAGYPLATSSLGEGSSGERAGSAAESAAISAKSPELRFTRYRYRNPSKPAAGDRGEAERFFAQGVQDQQVQRLPEAIEAYRRAAQLDPSYYDAHYNLGLAASSTGNLALALAAYETALALEPESLDARYNFGLVLKQGGYVLDAVNEFETILAKYPNDGRTHLALGNLYAQQLQQPAQARPHYLAVLSNAPQSPQAGAIRYWLSDHPR